MQLNFKIELPDCSDPDYAFRLVNSLAIVQQHLDHLAEADTANPLIAECSALLERELESVLFCISENDPSTLRELDPLVQFESNGLIVEMRLSQYISEFEQRKAQHLLN